MEKLTKDKILYFTRKTFFWLFILTVIFLAYQFQKPILDNSQLLIKVEEHLQKPPKGWVPLHLNIENIPQEDIEIVMTKKEGLFNQLTNQRQWSVTIKYNENVPTIILDAYNGNLIDIYGILN